MSRPIIAVIAIVVVALALTILRDGAKAKLAAKSSQSEPRKGDAQKVYLGLRDNLLRNSRSKIGGLPAVPTPETPWAVLMDWDMGENKITVVAVSDGTGSVYFDTGGGMIGGGQAYEPIAKAAKNAVSLAGNYVKQLERVTEFPLPGKHQVFIYVLTDAGVFRGTGSEEEMSTNRHPLSPLADALQEVITQYRLMPEKPAKS